MSIYTQVGTPSGVYMIRGKVTREHAIAEARRSYEAELARCQKFLALRDDEIPVHFVRGMHTGQVIGEPKP